MDFPSDYADCIVTSPAYFGQRIYGDDERELGAEASLDEYVLNLRLVADELRRVLKPEGVFWLNVSDCYANANKQGARQPSDKSTLIGMRYDPPTHRPENHKIAGRKMSEFRTKDLIPVGWSVATALQRDGWYLRAPVIWHKPNAMPSSARDRPGLDYEYVFMFTRGPKNYFDMEAVKQPAEWARWGRQTVAKYAGTGTGTGWMKEKSKEELQALGAGKKNLRAVWSIPTSNYKGAHSATFPPALPERCIAASCPVGGIVLDPFLGSGTTAMQAVKMGRKAVGIDLYPENIEQAVNRIKEGT
jgi:DNA modification methylase